jgi:DNA-binding PadR family transcriptional regulator
MLWTVLALIVVWFIARVIISAITSDYKKKLVLRILQQVYPRGLSGLELVELSGKELKRGSVYVYLSALEEVGLVKSWLEEKEDNSTLPPRRFYAITTNGLECLKALKITEVAKL